MPAILTENKLIEYLKSVDTPTLSNAIELLEAQPQSDGFTPLQIRCLFPEPGRMCGYAVTAQVETVTDCGAFDIDQFFELQPRAVQFGLRIAFQAAR